MYTKVTGESAAKQGVSSERVSHNISAWDVVI
ncbi:hypothetical protein JOD02_001529 [Caldicoprobacter guelmensis]|nr:hypothetical protein [Caldicoprobacter guelmensis]